jgi:hypothetical protein
VTEDNRRKNIALEAARGDASLKAAEVLLASGLLADAVSRAYYGAFHYARALLLTLGEEPVTHAGVERLLHRDFVRAGVISPELARHFGHLQKMRLDADYTSEFLFDAAGATDEVTSARRFVEAARAALGDGGWI